MRCTVCQSQDSKVIESRDVAEGESTRRRRECVECGSRFTTYERVERPSLVVVKRNDKREVFDREKISRGVERASEKTTITAMQREEIVSSVESQIYAIGQPEVGVHEIGQLVMDTLAKYDEVAYVRFASVYKNFTSVDNFRDSLDELKSNGK